MPAQNSRIDLLHEAWRLRPERLQALNEATIVVDQPVELLKVGCGGCVGRSPSHWEDNGDEGAQDGDRNVRLVTEIDVEARPREAGRGRDVGRPNLIITKLFELPRRSDTQGDFSTTSLASHP